MSGTRKVSTSNIGCRSHEGVNELGGIEASTLGIDGLRSNHLNFPRCQDDVGFDDNTNISGPVLR